MPLWWIPELHRWAIKGVPDPYLDYTKTFDRVLISPFVFVIAIKCNY